MWKLLKEFLDRSEGACTVILMDDEGLEQPQRFRVEPRRLLWIWGGTLGIGALLVLLLFAFTPLRSVLPGAATEELEEAAQQHAVRLASLRDSLSLQHQYVLQLQRLLTGEVDSSILVASARAPEPHAAASEELAAVTVEPSTQNWADHRQPALSVGMDSPPLPAAAPREVGVVNHIEWPVLPPVEGFLTRGFEARTGHFAVDIAVEEGTTVRSIGDGYVVFSDWTHDGGYTIAVQHADAWISTYKHNEQLLKRLGDRVAAREPIALSGNTGEVTTGPHLHVELWRNGLAQDPADYFLGW